MSTQLDLDDVAAGNPKAEKELGALRLDVEMKRETIYQQNNRITFLENSEVCSQAHFDLVCSKQEEQIIELEQEVERLKEKIFHSDYQYASIRGATNDEALAYVEKQIKVDLEGK